MWLTPIQMSWLIYFCIPEIMIFTIEGLKTTISWTEKKKNYTCLHLEVKTFWRKICFDIFKEVLEPSKY